MAATGYRFLKERVCYCPLAETATMLKVFCEERLAFGLKCRGKYSRVIPCKSVVRLQIESFEIERGRGVDREQRSKDGIA